MNTRKALFFDIDGTLFDSKTKTILPKTIQALDKLKKRGDCDLYLATGRSLETLGVLNNYLSYFRGLNLSNGQHVILDGKTIRENSIDKNTLEKLLIMAEENNYPMGLISAGDIEMNFFTEESYNNFTSYIKTNVKNLNHAPYDTNKKVYQIWIFESNDILDKLQIQFPTVDFLKWGNYGADILPKGASKELGIKAIQEALGYDAQNMYAFGDGDNDAKMFEVVKWSVAMGDSSLLARNSATFVTDKSINNGLYKAIVKLGLIEDEE